MTHAIHILSLCGQRLSAEEKTLLHAAHLVAGSKTLLDSLDILAPRRHAWGSPLENSLQFLEKCHSEGQRIVILADGDALYYGIGATLSRHPYFQQQGILHIHAGISMAQRICARAALPWHDVKHISLHGRPNPQRWAPLYLALTRQNAVCVLTDATASVQHIAQNLITRGAQNITLHCLECYGMQEEKYSVLSLEEAALYTAKQPCTALLLPAKASNPVHLGLPAHKLYRENELMTKPLVRASALSLLGILPEHILWDVGAGSGSLALEASSLAAQVVAFEQHEHRVAHIIENRRKFMALNMDIVHCAAPTGFETAPPPHRIFVGGGLSTDTDKSYKMLEALSQCLQEGGRMVISAVLLGTVQKVQSFFATKGWPVRLCQIHVNEGAPLSADIRLIPQNPVFLLTIDKKTIKNTA